MKEVKRIRIAVRMGSQGFSLKLTDASSDKVTRALSQLSEALGRDVCYHHEYDETVITVPVFEGEPDNKFDEQITRLGRKHQKK
jgi:hypothetical protein